MLNLNCRMASLLIVASFLTFELAVGQSNIIFILADDVGWSDFGYNYERSPIPTPFIDELANKGIQMKQYYTHSLCTPSRAALMTGRYHINTGLTYVLTPGSPAGLPKEIPTLPMILKNLGNYSAQMSGKWHLGHAKQSMTPIGRGFDSFTGIFMWDTDSFTKQFYSIAPPYRPIMVDWIREFSNGTYSHYAEPRHSTDAITHYAVDAIDRHAAQDSKSPLFLYVAYTAAHSPLQPLPHHEAACAHIPHLWRREFCGMVVGLDEGIRNVTEHALRTLGSNTIVVVTSDNGASTWFGGLNEPLRGTKSTAFEGGVRVPALIVDFNQPQAQSEAKHASRVFTGLMHVSDWLPTLLSYAGIPAERFPAGLDGMDFKATFDAIFNDSEEDSKKGLKKSLRVDPKTKDIREIVYDVPGPRREVLLEMYYAEDHIFGEESVAYRLGDYKYIRGIQRDPNYYTEPKTDRVTLDKPTWTTFLLEKLIRAVEVVFGSGPFDTFRIILTHVTLHNSFATPQKAGTEPVLRLYNIKNDPRETINLAGEPHVQSVIAEIEKLLAVYKLTRLTPQKVWLQHDPEHVWPKTFVPGDCSMNDDVRHADCHFTRPWVPEEVDPWKVEGMSTANEIVDRVFKLLYIILITTVVVILASIRVIFFRNTLKSKK